MLLFRLHGSLFFENPIHPVPPRFYVRRTRFGPHLVRKLARMGHSVTVFHRGRTNPELPGASPMQPSKDVQIRIIKLATLAWESPNTEDMGACNRFVTSFPKL